MPKKTAEDVAFEKEFKDSLKVDKDAFLESVLTGQQVSSNKPYYGGTPQQMAKSTLNEGSVAPENHVDVFASVVGTLGSESVAAAIAQHPGLTNPGLTKFASAGVGEQMPMGEQLLPENLQYISPRQASALAKFPALIEFLGMDEGEEIAKEIAAKVNTMMVVKIGKNAKGISEYAQSCVADKQNLKQFYVGPDKQWVCEVIASGPFRGDEALYYDPEQEKSFVLRGKSNTDVSSDFNLIHQYAEQKAEMPEVK